MTKEEAREYLQWWKDNVCTGNQKMTDALVMAIKELEKPEKMGHWKLDIDYSRGWDWRRFYCSECGDWNTYGEPKYCPKCGTHMYRYESAEEE